MTRWPATTTPPAPGAYACVGDVIDADAVQAVFQPLVELDSGAVVAYEALARGPAGSPWESPAALFGAASREGRVSELDWVCRAAAFRAALAVGLDVPLFVNVEPASLRTPCPPRLQELVQAAGNRLQIVFEVTERAVASDPAGLLAAVARARAGGAGIALDDVGAEPASLAMMPFVDPDVVKLDLRLVQERTSPEVAGIVTAVLAHAERTGARVLAEGIEESRHVDIARTLGASLGQGWLFGRPGRLPGRPEPGSRPDFLRFRPAPDRGPADTPFSVVTARRPAFRSRKELLRPLSLHLEQRSLMVEPGVLLACFQDVVHFTPATRERYEKLAGATVLTAALGVGMPAVPAAAVRGGRLEPDDPLRAEWDVVVIGPQFASALVARDLGDTGRDGERRFDAVITHDRDLVIQAALTLVHRLLAARPGVVPDAWSTPA